MYMLSSATLAFWKLRRSSRTNDGDVTLRSRRAKLVENWSLNHLTIGMLWAEIADAVSLDGLDRKWQVDGAALVNKLQAGGMIGQAALVDASERWWNRVAAGEQPAYSELLAGGLGYGNPR